jgi:hypothetical protein
VNEAQAVRLRPKVLPRPLAKRCIIDPFIVMDVMAEANARAKTGEDISRRTDVSRFTANSEAFAKAMLKDIGVAVTPGIDFDPERGRSYLRFSYAGPEPRMREAASGTGSKRDKAGKRERRASLID